MAKTKRPPPVPLEKFNKHFSSSTQWGERWNSLYAALLTPTRYVTLRNKFAAEGAFDTCMQGLALEQVLLPLRHLPTSGLQCFISSAPQGEPRPYPEPVRSTNSLSTHWNLDLASLLAVSVLGVQPGDKVLDLCAAPGGKSIALAQSIFPSDRSHEQMSAGCLHSNEYNVERMRRLDDNLGQYLPDAVRRSKQSICLHQDGTLPTLVFPCGISGYDKVLLDAPCSSERHIIHAQERVARSAPSKSADELSRWSPGLAKRLAETQAKLLQNALRSVRLDGRVLYATCSISKEENDEVVESAVRWSQLQHKKGVLTWTCQLDTVPDDLATKLEAWAERTRTGWIVLPDHDTPYGTGWGPLFFAVLTKTKP